MSLRSKTGQFVVVSGPTIVGPFDGRGPADQFARDARKAGKQVKVVRLFSESTARKTLPAPSWKD